MAKAKFSPVPGQGSLVLMGGETFYQSDKTAAWRPPAMIDLPSWRGAKRIGIDTEFRDATLLKLGVGVRRDPTEYYMCGISFAIEDGPKHYLPFAHEGGDNLDKAQVLSYMRDQCATFDGDIVGANLSCDLDWLMEAGIAFPKVRRFYDVQIADPLIYEHHHSYRLGDICTRWDFEGKSEEALRAAARERGLDAKADLWRFPARHVGIYAEDDAWKPLGILRKQEVKIAEDGLEAAWEMESRLLPILIKMTRKGIRVNINRVEQVEQWSKTEEQKAWDIVKRETGVIIPVGECMNVGLLTDALKKAGLEHCIGSTNLGKASVTKDGLTLEPHPVAQAIIAARKASVIRTTFVNGTKDHVIRHGDEWRIHCTFNQIRKTEESGKDDDSGVSKGVKFGRLSASHTNMQNQPAADRRTGDNRIGCMWRSVYEPEHGTEWTSCDLKQQEPKWSFHIGAIMEEAKIEGVRGALAMCERLNANPRLDTYEPLVDLTSQPRPVCKIMWLSRAYNKGDGNLCKDLGLSTRPVTFSFRLYKDAMKNGMNKYDAKVIATVPVDTPEGEEAIKRGSFTWDGAGPEGRVIIDKFDSEMPFLKVCGTIAKDRAKEFGFIKLMSGRRCHFEKSPDARGFLWTETAFNKIIQGNAAEQTKEITIAVDDAGFGDFLMLQVHDELDASLATQAQGDAMAEVMRTAVPMRVPTVVDIERGPSWGESMTVEFKDDSGKKQKYKYRWEL